MITMETIEEVTERVATVAEQLCKRCGHNWLKRILSRPQQCPRCRSPYWDRERKQSVK